jgi:hypothetical protein
MVKAKGDTYPIERVHLGEVKIIPTYIDDVQLRNMLTKRREFDNIIYILKIK